MTTFKGVPVNPDDRVPKYIWLNGKGVMWALGTGRGLGDWLLEGRPDPPDDWEERYKRNGHPTLRLVTREIDGRSLPGNDDGA